MGIVEFFNNCFKNVMAVQSDFLLTRYKDNVLVGLDQKLNVVVITKTMNPNRSPLIHKTRKMCIECNMKVQYELDGSNHVDVVHIIRCMVPDKFEKELFLELCTIMISTCNGSEEKIMDTFSILRTFFSERKEYSDNELIGLYAELYTIIIYKDSLHLERYWQSRDKMKFDFSISEKLKLEIKSTTQNSRMHHFRHEQLMTSVYDIYVMSYLFRYDDEGTSLYDLIIECKELLMDYPNKLLRINSVLRNVSEDRLKTLRFNRDYTDQFRRLYRAVDIPKFNEVTPAGVTNAEYDCILDTINDFDQSIFNNIVTTELNTHTIS